MTALSAGILIFLIVMLSAAASINYLRQWRQRRRSLDEMNARDEGRSRTLSAAAPIGGNDNRGAAGMEGRRSTAGPSAINPAAPGPMQPSKTRVVYARKYRAVGVRPQLNCCRAVLVFGNIRFLAEEAPHFPVPGCDAESCRCQYIYFADRREEERRSTFGMARGWTPATGRDRRRAERRRTPQ